jgi:hypothetical protein
MNRRAALRRFSRERATDEQWLPAREGVGRRRWLKRLGGAALGVGTLKALDNVVVGYGVVTGTNLTEQTIGDYAGAPFRWSDRAAPVPGGRVEMPHDRDQLVLRGAGERTVQVAEATPAEARKAAAAVAIDPGAVEELLADIHALRRGDARYEGVSFTDFGEAVDKGTVRSATTALLRPYFLDTDPETVASFTGVHPREPVEMAPALAEAFREETYYDLPRYAAGSVEDNVIMGTADLRQYFESPTSFEALAEGRTQGMFCYEFTFRSAAAFHAAPVTEQSPPVAASKAVDDRHKHVYTALATVTRQDGEVVVPTTFVDYTHTTLYDDLKLRGVLGEGLDGYTSRHRITGLPWWDGGEEAE